MHESGSESATGAAGSASTARGFAVAILATAAAVAARGGLDSWLGDSLPLVTLFGAVAASVWVGGWGPAVVSMVLGFLACEYLFMRPRGLVVFDVGKTIGFIAYLGTSAVVILLGEIARRTRASLRTQRDYLQTILASIGDGVILTDMEGRVTYLNPVAQAATGWTLADARGEKLEEVFRIVNEATRLPVENPAVRALRDGTAVGLANHTILIRKDGGETPIDDSAAPIRDEMGRVAGCVLVFRDVSSRRQSELEAAERNQAARFLAALVESSHDAIVSKNLDGVIQSWNDGASRLFGYTAEEAVGKLITLLIPPDRLHEEVEIINRLRAGRRIEHFDTIRRHKDGTLIDVSVSISPVRDDAGTVVAASKIVRDISEQKESERRFYQLMTELNEAAVRKDVFLATLAHELRGPLAPIRNSLEILNQIPERDPTRKEALETVDRQSAQLQRLVDDLLDLSRITHGKLELRRQEVMLEQVLRQALEAVRPMADCVGHRLEHEIPKEPILLMADPARLAQVFGNLLNNACKYTEKPGSIHLTVVRNESDVTVAIKDSGIGIAPETLPTIFDMFVQADRRLEHTHGGLGIGLTLVKQLVEMHGGSVEAHSDGLDKGSEFRVRLPVLKTAFSAAAPSDNSKPKWAEGRRILIVDDNKDSANSLAVLLRIAGNETKTAHDGVDALEQAEAYQPDVVVLDIGLPKLNGFDVCERLRAGPGGRELIIVALTGWGQSDVRQRAKAVGFDFHMVKPVDHKTLLASLDRISNGKCETGDYERPVLA